MITADGVIRDADTIAKDAMSKLTLAEVTCHNDGYHAYSTALANMRYDIELALNKLVEEVSQ